MPYIEGARFRMGVEAGASSDMTGYGPVVYAGTANAGTPGTAFGAGTIEPGGLVLTTTGKKVYVNTGTKLAPTWTPVGSQAA